MGGHNHSHGGHGQKADCWINVGTSINWLWGLCSDAFWLGGLFDSALGYDEDIAGLSFYGLGLGLTLALLSAGGDAYCHRIININNQPASDATHAHGGYASCDKLDDAPSRGGVAEDAASLTVWQKVALVGDAVSHVGTTSGGLTTLVYAVAGKKYKIETQCVATFFGVVATVADVRACKNAIQEYNRKAVGR